MSILMINETGKTYNKIGLSEKGRLYQQFALIQLSSIEADTSTSYKLGVNPLSSCTAASSGGTVVSSFNVTPTHNPVIDINPMYPSGAMYLRKHLARQGKIKELYSCYQKLKLSSLIVSEVKKNTRS